jgi:SAM-dependent methyltransferase
MSTPLTVLLRRWRATANRTVRPVDWGNLRRLEPVSDRYGYDRGISADRALVDAFIASHADDIRGDVLEVRDPLYAGRHGSRVTTCEVLDIDSSNRAATLIADLGDSESLPAARFDCFILTQTLYLVRDPVTALRNAYQCLRPGGTLLLTTPVVARIDPSAGSAADYWRLEPAGLEELLRAALPADAAVDVRGSGNVLVCVSTLMGIAAEELSPEELLHNDSRYPVITAARIARPS